MSDIDDLNTLAQKDDVIQVAGKDVKINRIRMGQLSEVLTFCAPIKDQIFRAKPASLPNQPAPKPIDIPAIMASHGPALAQLIANIQKHDGQEWITAEWINDLELDEAIFLIRKVFEANLDFFIQKVVPALSQALVSVTAGIKPLLPRGTTPSAP